jgi:hypothetical protein
MRSSNFITGCCLPTIIDGGKSPFSTRLILSAIASEEPPDFAFPDLLLLVTG